MHAIVIGGLTFLTIWSGDASRVPLHEVCSTASHAVVASTLDSVPRINIDRDMYVAVLRTIDWSEVCRPCHVIIVDSGIHRPPLPDPPSDSGTVAQVPARQMARLSNKSRTFTLGRYSWEGGGPDTIFVAITMSSIQPSNGAMEFLLHIASRSTWGVGAWVQVEYLRGRWRAELVGQGES
jgi:hypothetical protein